MTTLKTTAFIFTICLPMFCFAENNKWSNPFEKAFMEDFCMPNKLSPDFASCQCSYKVFNECFNGKQKNDFIYAKLGEKILMYMDKNKCDPEVFLNRLDECVFSPMPK